MAQPERTLRESALPTFDVVRGSIDRPTINVNKFEIKTTTIQMIQNNLQLWGNMIEDQNQNLKRFLQLCDTFKYNRVTKTQLVSGCFCSFFVTTATNGSIPKSQAWESFNSQLKKCPHHSMQDLLQLQIFYNGLDGCLRADLDGTSTSAFMNNT
ncbi:oligopeptide transporter 4-like [Gossypium australe]|uniref:Oligopeptide transporter 4-like n=1 Tax=Gossypium australe TaxID=47621 RepID=A0A5B6VLU5_9ROSI|nr:oligopeptide transporter 4-like [Gossypium australe]